MQIIRPITISVCMFLICGSMFAQGTPFRRTLSVSIAAPVILDIAVSRGDINIGYARDSEVSIHASAKDLKGNNVSDEFFTTGLLVDQHENHISIRDSVTTAADVTLNISYTIDVPFQTEVNSTISNFGNQKLIGIAGPARLSSGAGDIDITYVRFARVEAFTGKGNISCSRSAEVKAETGAGNITLMEDGASKAAVRKGPGRIEVGGARGGFEGTTDIGDVHIKAVLNDDWHLTSVAGNIRVEVPPKAKFNLDASTALGQIYIEHNAVQKPPDEIRELRQQVNGGGKTIQARSNNGNIFIQ